MKTITTKANTFTTDYKQNTITPAFYAEFDYNFNQANPAQEQITQ